jgi:hypothetical protein
MNQDLASRVSVPSPLRSLPSTYGYGGCPFSDCKLSCSTSHIRVRRHLVVRRSVHTLVRNTPDPRATAHSDRSGCLARALLSPKGDISREIRGLRRRLRRSGSVFWRNIFRKSDFVGRSDTEEKIVGEEMAVMIALAVDFQIHFRAPR